MPPVPRLGLKGGWGNKNPDGYCDPCQEKRREQAELAEKERLARESRKHWVNALGGERAYQTFTLVNYKPSTALPEGFPNTLNLYIYGPVGCGKTHLATAFAREAAQYPSQIEIVKPMDIFREVRKGGDAEWEEKVMRGYVQQKILILDDLGVSKDTEFALQVLYEIIDARYMNMAGGLIITSNLSLNDLSQKLGDDRIVSRIAGMCRLVKLEGADQRLNNITKNRSEDGYAPED